MFAYSYNKCIYIYIYICIYVFLFYFFICIFIVFYTGLWSTILYYFFVLGSYYCYLLPKKYILFSRVYSKAKYMYIFAYLNPIKICIYVCVLCILFLIV